MIAAAFGSFSLLLFSVAAAANKQTLKYISFWGRDNRLLNIVR
jgi:hypothetical protein